MEIKAFYDDRSLAAYYKPSYLHSVGLASGPAGASLADYILMRFPEAAKVSDKPEDAGLINRLDYETRGLILAAKTRECWTGMRELFSRREIKKFYYAVLEGELKNPEITISNYIGSSSRNSKKVKVFEKMPRSSYRAREAVSRFKLLKYNSELDLSLVEVKISSGVRHQIRAHAAWLGNPLAGDSLYGSTGAELPAFFLQAACYEFKHPLTGEALKLESPLEDSARALFF